MKRLLLLALLILSSVCHAQTDTAFWFTAPHEFSNVHSSYLHIFTSDQSAIVTISIPAASSLLYPPITDTIAANSFSKHHLRYAWVGRNIGTVPDVINNLGILITSTAPISCYLDYSHMTGDITSLKGSHALGTDFVVPMQNSLDCYPNGYDRGHIGVVATQDSTVVQMAPPPGRAFNGLGIDEPVTVTLNRGQSYGRESAGITAQDRLGGTSIHASRPIAVCFADYDLTLTAPSSSIQQIHNVVGDQILPIDKTGTRYVAIRSQDADSEHFEQVWVFPNHPDDTVEVYFNGILQDLVYRQYNGPLFLEDSATLITLDKAAAVLQMTTLASDFGGVGMTMLPPIDCTGTHKVSYMRYSENTMLHILTKRAFVSDFLFNGDSTFITASDFHTLPADTTLAWCCKEIVTPIGTQYYSIDSLITIENASGMFHLGVLEHRGGYAITEGERSYHYDCVFGYFYDYNQSSHIHLTLDTAYCRGDSIVFNYHASHIDGLELRGPNGLHITQPPFVLHNIDSNASGRYYLEGFDTASCLQLRIDSIDIVVKGGQLRLLTDTLFCIGDSILLDYTASPDVVEVRLHGPNGLVMESLPLILTGADTSISGLYWIEGRDTGDCPMTIADSLYIHITDNYYSQVYDTIAESQLPWMRYDTLFNEDADTTFVIPISTSVCDSIVDYHLKVFYNMNDTVLYYACENNLPIQYDTALFFQEGQATILYSGSHGEDSLVTFILHVIPSSDTTIYDTITEDQLPWFSFDTLFNDTVSDYIYHLFNEAGCDSLIHYNLYIFWNGDHCDTDLSYPNVVTPNGDGVNDRFVIGGLIEHNCFKYSELTIYDRYGHCVYHKRNIANDSDWWNPAAQRAPSGTYFYYFKAHGVNIWTQHRGVIEVLRDK